MPCDKMWILPSLGQFPLVLLMPVDVLPLAWTPSQLRAHDHGYDKILEGSDLPADLPLHRKRLRERARPSHHACVIQRVRGSVSASSATGLSRPSGLLSAAASQYG